MFRLQTEAFKELQTIKGIAFPRYLKFRQLLITGPPGAGKSALIEKIGAWPEEGVLDLSQNNWWRNRMLTFRPREVHLSLPFKGIPKAMVLHEEAWLNTGYSLELDLSRIRIPPPRNRFLPLNWRTKYVFEFNILSPKKIFKLRKKRKVAQTHHIDVNLDFKQVKHQVSIYRQVAFHLHECGLLVYLRENFEGTPKRIRTESKRFVDMAHKPKGQDLFEKLKGVFFRPIHRTAVYLNREIYLKGESVVLPHNGIPIQLMLGKGGTILHVYPEHFAVASKKLQNRDYLIFNPAEYFSKISGFLRLGKGEKLVIGKSKRQDAMIQFSPNVSKRHLMISHNRKGLLIEDLESESGIYVSSLTQDREIYRIADMQTKKMNRLKEIFGHPIKLLPSEEAFSLLLEVNEALGKESFRPDNVHGQPGGVYLMPDDMTPIIVGDLHAQVDNLLKILTEPAVLESLEQKIAYMLILGDAVHSEIDGEMEQMESSLLMMDLLFMLKIKFPEQIFYIRGNHDSFSKNLYKSGIPQGLLWERAVLKYRGQQYFEEMERYYNQLAYVAIARDFFVCHASPPRRTVDLEMLKNIKDHKGLIEELTMNRVKNPGYPAGYTQSSVKSFRRALQLDPHLPFIVSHNPMSRKNSVWLKAGKIKRHHIVFSGMPHEVSIFSRISDRIMPLTFTSEALQERMKQLPKDHQLQVRCENESEEK
ncbi:MAG: metallophosphoesterase [SAR324 cluster bacterium]|nr:metallophosphoesterase [SAR324 cluster bacterium]